ncbi:MAG: ABC transporter ATP-binding protein [Corynebacterium sp.]|nr:ABC transporter ATP-binding protein [Corynebacterium sp.]
MSTTNPTVGQLVMWLIGITRPVLAPLGVSTLCRIANQVLGILLYVVPVYALMTQTMSVTTVVIAMIVMALVKAFLRYLEHYFGHLVAFKALELIRIRAFRDIYPQAPAIMTRTGTNAVGSGDMLTRLTRDIAQIEVFFAHTTAPVISALVVPIAVVIMIAVVLPWQGLVAAGILLLAALISVDTSAYKFAVGVTGARGKIAQHVTDSIGGVAEVTGYGAVERRHRELAELETPLVSSIIRRSGIVGTRGGLIAAARMSVVLMLLPPTDNLALSVAAMFAVLRCWDMINEVTDLGNHFSQSLAAARRVWGLSHAGLALPDGGSLIDAHGPGVSVQWRDVSFTYDGAPQPVVRDVSLEVAPGSWTTVVGSTGSGKSTIAKLLLRYWDVDSGSVVLDGRDIRDYNVDALRSAVAVVTQDIRPMNATVAENLRLAAPNATEAELADALYLACLDGEVELSDSVGEGGAALSGGQRQRLSLAQALLRGGRVLVLDEFTAHLNPTLVAEVRARLQQAFPSVTVIEIAHDLDNIGGADWVAVMDQGEIVEQGSPEHLRAQQGVLHHLLHRDRQD